MLAFRGHPHTDSLLRNAPGEPHRGAARADPLHTGVMDRRDTELPTADNRSDSRSGPFLRIPPFPGSKQPAFVRPIRGAAANGADTDALLETVRLAKVGGTYWGRQPQLPNEPYVVVRIGESAELLRRIERISAGARTVVWLDSCVEAPSADGGRVHIVRGVCDPWHLLSGASAAIVDADDELALIAAIAGIPLQCIGEGPFSALSGDRSPSTLRSLFSRHAIDGCAYFDPYSGDPISFRRAVEYCGFWRNLIDSNRDIRAAVGFAFWKRSTVGPLLWRGSEGTPFRGGATGIAEGEQVALWRSRAAPATIARLENRAARLIEVEDGFVRSAGLGAECVPPLSIVVDRLAAHFDSNRPSELEHLLQRHVFSDEIVERARELRQILVDSGVSKYDAGRISLDRRAGQKLHVLVPGQVEDDRSVLCGGGPATNFDLLRKVRAQRPDAYIMYRPHPDVEAGHRRGAIAEDLCLSIADEIVAEAPISALLDLADEVHVNTSLAGFEALIRHKPVTTYGVPFYAGWGLTHDLGPVPERRTARRTLDELVAAVLLLYPRYLDPITGLPCPAEVLVRRLAARQASGNDGIVVRFRKLQGRCKRGLAALRWSR